MAGSPLSSPRELRFRWYLQVEKYSKSVTEVCSIFGISRKTFYKWYNKDCGYGSNKYRSRRIHPHTKLTPNIKVIVYDNKINYNYGPKKMQLFLKNNYEVNVSTTTIYKYYKKKKLIRKPQKKLKWYIPLKEPYFAKIAGENVQLDIKYVPGKDMEWNYQYRFIDTVTNLQFATNMPFKEAASSIQAFKKAKEYFPFKISGIQTDNGSEFRGIFHEYLIRQNIIH